MKRTFVGIDIDAGHDFRNLYQEIRNALEGEKIRWTRPENLHITLHFFGDTPEKKIPLIKTILDATAKHNDPFHFRVTGAGVFRSPHHPRVFWLGLEETAGMAAIQEELSEKLASSGFDADARPFRPHLTLGRMKRINNRDHLIAVLDQYRKTEFMTVHVSGITFYESTLTAKGSVYEVISHHLLGG